MVPLFIVACIRCQLLETIYEAIVSIGIQVCVSSLFLWSNIILRLYMKRQFLPVSRYALRSYFYGVMLY